ncbi:hypothetical protein HHX47_DHR1000933 [Lentinula edodes]|nr:hypothetical protein HHX47_DHR1000933 [Lentinula edodes]
MKFYVSLLAIVSAVVAQSAQIGAPQTGSSVVAGSNFTVMIERPNSLSSSQEVSIVIGLAPCGETECPDPKSELGEILYQGPFNPQYATPPDSLPPHQNYSLQVPASFAVGRATLAVAHLSLIGAITSFRTRAYATVARKARTALQPGSQLVGGKPPNPHLSSLCSSTLYTCYSTPQLYQ